jgi:hypothetical protein
MVDNAQLNNMNDGGNVSGGLEYALEQSERGLILGDPSQFPPPGYLGTTTVTSPGGEYEAQNVSLPSQDNGSYVDGMNSDASASFLDMNAPNAPSQWDSMARLAGGTQLAPDYALSDGHTPSDLGYNMANQLPYASVDDSLPDFPEIEGGH